MIAYKKLIRIFFYLLFFFLLVFAKFFTDAEKTFQDKLYPNVYIDNINFGKKSKANIVQYFQQKNDDLKKIKFTIIFEDSPVATLSGEQINLHYDSEGLAERAYLIGRSSNLASKYYQKIATVFLNQSFQINSSLDYDKDEIKENLTRLEESYNKPAKNALFQFEDNKVLSFRQEEFGRQILSSQFLDDFDTKIYGLKNKKVNNVVVVVKSKMIEPEITLAKANNYGIEELIGEGKSDYTHSIEERVYNIILAASKFNGILIPKDKIFSFNDTIGDISASTGYKQAYIIKAGKTILGDGGGICQVSTTLFRAALNSGLPIIERHPHAYRVGYYENDAKPGLDATVFSPSVDLKIKNDTPAYILIQTKVDENNNLLYFRFYGKKDNRKVEISTPVLWDVQAPPESLYQDEPTLKKGVIKQVDFAAWGGKANFTYKVTYADGTVKEDSFYSSYKPWQAVYLVGTAD